MWAKERHSPGEAKDVQHMHWAYTTPTQSVLKKFISMLFCMKPPKMWAQQHQIQLHYVALQCSIPGPIMTLSRPMLKRSQKILKVLTFSTSMSSLVWIGLDGSTMSSPSASFNQVQANRKPQAAAWLRDNARPGSNLDTAIPLGPWVAKRSKCIKHSRVLICYNNLHMAVDASNSLHRPYPSSGALHHLFNILWLCLQIFFMTTGCTLVAPYWNILKHL